MTTPLIPISNVTSAYGTDRAFLFHFGAYGWTQLYVFATGLESALEEAVEWLDDHAPGILTTVSEADYKRAAEDLGVPWDPESQDFHRVTEHAERDMTMIGHTTLKNGNAIPSWEWTAREVTGDELAALNARVCTECSFAETSYPGLCGGCAVEALDGY